MYHPTPFQAFELVSPSNTKGLLIMVYVLHIRKEGSVTLLVNAALLFSVVGITL